MNSQPDNSHQQQSGNGCNYRGPNQSQKPKHVDGPETQALPMPITDPPIQYTKVGCTQQSRVKTIRSEPNMRNDTPLSSSLVQIPLFLEGILQNVTSFTTHTLRIQGFQQNMQLNRGWHFWFGYLSYQYGTVCRKIHCREIIVGVYIRKSNSDLNFESQMVRMVLIFCFHPHVLCIMGGNFLTVLLSFKQHIWSLFRASQPVKKRFSCPLIWYCVSVMQKFNIYG